MPVEQGARPRVSDLRKKLVASAKALTFPLLPDDYLALINPLWSAREMQGTIVEVRKETPRATTVVIKPSFRWPGHRAGQYIRIGVERDGVRHWRAYSLTSDHPHPKGLISISVRHVDEGLISSYLNRDARPGAIIYLGEVEGTFCLPDPLTTKLLMISAGSGVTPVFAMLRDLSRRGAGADVVHIHSERNCEDIMFAEHYERIGQRLPGYQRIEHLTSEQGHLEPKDLDELVPDWRERTTYLSGPPEMLQSFEEYYDKEGLCDQLELEHFQPYVMEGDGELGEGGTIRFRGRDGVAESDGKTPILDAGEEAGIPLRYGCRMGICHTCTCKLISGRVRDLRTGEVFGEEGEIVRICISAPEGDVEMQEGHIVMDGTESRSKA